jgi:nucleoside-diphosphate-sugar epimerase
MNICIIGHNGFVGQTVYNYLADKHNLCGINSKTEVSSISSREFDVVINCAGNAKKYIANKDPSLDFTMNTNVFSKILMLKMNHLIHISSIEASKPPDNNYTISKLIIEKCSKLYFPKCTILRLGGLVGPNLKKNVVFDIANNKDLFVTENSTYNYISTEKVAKIIEKIIHLKIDDEIINIAASQPISVKDIIKEAKNKSIFFNGSMGRIYETYNNIDINKLTDFFPVKTSRYYLRQYLNNLCNK